MCVRDGVACNTARLKTIRWVLLQLLVQRAHQAEVVDPQREGVGADPPCDIALAEPGEGVLAGVVGRPHAGEGRLLGRLGLRIETLRGIAQTASTRYLAPQPTGRFGG